MGCMVPITSCVIISHLIYYWTQYSRQRTAAHMDYGLLVKTLILTQGQWLDWLAILDPDNGNGVELSAVLLKVVKVEITSLLPVSAYSDWHCHDWMTTLSVESSTSYDRMNKKYAYMSCAQICYYWRYSTTGRRTDKAECNLIWCCTLSVILSSKWWGGEEIQKKQRNRYAFIFLDKPWNLLSSWALHIESITCLFLTHSLVTTYIFVYRIVKGLHFCPSYQNY